MAQSAAQRAVFAEPVVPMGEGGARMLSGIYWREVERTDRGFDPSSRVGDGPELRLAGRGPHCFGSGLRRSAHAAHPRSHAPTRSWAASWLAGRAG